MKDHLRSNGRQLIRRVQLVGVVSPGERRDFGLRQSDTGGALLRCRSPGGNRYWLRELVGKHDVGDAPREANGVGVTDVADGREIFPSTPFGSISGASKISAAVSRRLCTVLTSS